MAQQRFPGEAGDAGGSELMARCAELDAALEALKVRYEQYFLGLHRLPPSEEHALVRSGILRLRSSPGRNTAVRFRAQSIHNRLLTYERMWQRTCREIEEGTYRRDLAKVRRKTGATSAVPAVPRRAADDFEVDEAPEDSAPTGTTARTPGDETVSASRSDSTVRKSGTAEGTAPADRGASAASGEMQRPSAEAAPNAVGGRPSSGVSAARTANTQSNNATGMSEERMRALYEAYIGAKRRCKESTEGLTFDAVSSALKRQVPELMLKHNASGVDFKVVIKDGKAVLKALPR